MKQSLYSMTADLREIQDALERGDENADALAQAWIIANGKLPDKIDAYCGLYRSLLAEASVYDGEYRHWLAKREAAQNAAQRLKDSLKWCIETLGVEEIAGKLFKARIVGNGGMRSVTVDVPVDQLPVEFTTLKVEPNKVAIRTALEEGVEVPGCRLEPRGTRVEIK